MQTGAVGDWADLSLPTDSHSLRYLIIACFFSLWQSDSSFTMMPCFSGSIEMNKIQEIERQASESDAGSSFSTAVHQLSTVTFFSHIWCERP